MIGYKKGEKENNIDSNHEWLKQKASAFLVCCKKVTDLEKIIDKPYGTWYPNPC